MLQAPKLLLFDFDGTLADSFHTTLAVANRLAPAYGYPPLDPERAHHLKNLGIRQIIRTSGIPLRRLPSWIRQMKQEMNREIPNLKPQPGLHTSLFNLRNAGISLGIVTSNSSENVDLFLQNHQWHTWFDHIATGSTLFGKSRLIKRLLERTGHHPEQAAYVGDEERDIEAARRSGVFAVAVTWGYNHRHRLALNQPDFLIDSAEELSALFLSDPF